VSRLVLILLICALTLQTGFKLMLYLNYQVSKEQITVKYCENKDKPKLKCLGKCHLNKLLIEASKGDEQNKNEGKELSEFSPCIYSGNESLSPWYSIKTKAVFHYLMAFTEARSAKVFHPPLGVSFNSLL
jgi:hypothetical protein